MTKSFTEKYAIETCKLGQKAKCCSYLACGPEGFGCLKGGSLKKVIDQRRAAKSMRAMGDNCKGYSDEKN